MQKVGLKYGAICGLVYIVVQMIQVLFAKEIQAAWYISIFVTLITVGGTFAVIYFGIKEYRDTVNNGLLTIGEGVKLGALIGLIAAVVSAVFGLLYNYVIDPGMMDRMLEEMRAGLEDRGMSDADIERTMKISSMFKNPVLSSAFAIVWYGLWGLVKGLISGAILKKEATPTYN